MRTGHVVNLIGIAGQARSDRSLLCELGDLRVAVRGRMGGLHAAASYMLQRGNGDGLAGDYPDLLLVYEFRTRDALARWAPTPGYGEGLFGRIASAAGGRVAWNVDYECIGTWQQTPDAAVLKIIGMQPPTPATEARLNAWYRDRHIPEELAFAGVLGAARHRLVGASVCPAGITVERPPVYPRYLAVYYYVDLPAAEAWDASPQRAVAYQNVSDLMAQTGIRRLWWARYVPLDQWRPSRRW